MTDFVPIKLYLDEHIWSGLPQALAQRGYDAIHARVLGHIAWEDSDHLTDATEQGRAVLTFNIADFELLAAEWFFADREHEGAQSTKDSHNAAKPQPKGRADAPLQRGFSGCLP